MSDVTRVIKHGDKKRVRDYLPIFRKSSNGSNKGNQRYAVKQSAKREAEKVNLSPEIKEQISKAKKIYGTIPSLKSDISIGDEIVDLMPNVTRERLF